MMESDKTPLSNEPPKDPKERKKWKEEKKAKKRKWKEEKLFSQMEKQQKREMLEEEKKKKLDDEKALVERLGQKFTVSIALPGSILDNAQSPELRTYLAGQIARAAVVFNVDEIIIFDETGSIERTTEGEYDGIGKHGRGNVQLARILQYLECPQTTEGEYDGIGKHGRGNVQLARILQYLECPQYLRKSFFPQHKDLQYAGILNPLDCPHHMRAEDDFDYREGVILDKPIKDGKGSYVNVGLLKEAQVDRQIQKGVRVTVKLDKTYEGKRRLKGKIVSPLEPKVVGGLYWGYSVRLARSLGAVFTECPYKDPYDLRIGTSERGDSVDQFKTDPFKHAVIVFGGVKGLEASLEADESLNVNDPTLLFHHYLNTCPNQGSRTIRSEEAILITMSALRPNLFSGSGS